MPVGEDDVTDTTGREPPFEGGSQPVKQQPPEVPGPGRTAMQWFVIVLAVVLLLGSLIYFLRLF